MRSSRWILCVVLCCGFVLGGAAVAQAANRDDALPGVPKGPGVFSGAVDKVDKTDIFAVQLYEGESVTFRLSDPSGGWKQSRLLLWSPDTKEAPAEWLQGDRDYLIDDALIMGSDAVIEYTASRTAVYYLQVLEAANAGAYNLSIAGNASLPSNATRWTTRPASGFSSTPAYGQPCVLKGTLSPIFTSLGLDGTSARLQSSVNTTGWVDVQTIVGSRGVFYYNFSLTSAMYYRWVFDGDGVYAGSTGAAYLVKPQAYVRTPIAPSTMSHSRYYTIYGYLKPRHTAGTHPVRIYRYRYVSGHWKSYGYVSAKASNYSTYTKYLVSVKLAYTGKWKVRAYAPADSGHAAAWSSGYDYITVK